MRSYSLKNYKDERFFSPGMRLQLSLLRDDTARIRESVSDGGQGS